jgi:hypothetical protein
MTWRPVSNPGRQRFHTRSSSWNSPVSSNPAIGVFKAESATAIITSLRSIGVTSIDPAWKVWSMFGTVRASMENLFGPAGLNLALMQHFGAKVPCNVDGAAGCQLLILRYGANQMKSPAFEHAALGSQVVAQRGERSLGRIRHTVNPPPSSPPYWLAATSRRSSGDRPASEPKMSPRACATASKVSGRTLISSQATG